MNIVTITNTVSITLITIMYLSLLATLAEVIVGERLFNLGTAKKTLDNSPHS